MTLAAKTLSAVKSNYIGTLVRIGAQFLAQIVIMRELGPDVVGTFGYALLLFGVLALAIDQGFGWALIGAERSAAEIKTVFSRLLLASAIGMVAVYFLSYPIAAYLGKPLVGQVIRYSAPSYLVIAIYGISHATLRAELRFREIQFATTGAYLVAYLGIGVALALAGAGVWSLLAAWYVQSILQFVIGFYYRPHSLALGNPFVATAAGPLGRQVAGINLANWAVDNSSGVFVSALGPAALGSFNAASMLSRTPAMQLAQTMQTVLFSTATALGEDRGRIKRLFLGALAAIALVVMPAYGYAITHADLLINLVFGSKWLGAASLFAAMAIGMVALAISTLSGSILTATGGQRAVFRSQVLCLVLMCLGLYWSLAHGLDVVGITITVAYLARLLLQLAAVIRSTEVTVGDVLGALRGPFVLALLFALPSPARAHALAYAALALGAQVLLALLLVRLLPRFFVCAPLRDVLDKFGAGRKLLRVLAP